MRYLRYALGHTQQKPARGLFLTVSNDAVIKNIGLADSIKDGHFSSEAGELLVEYLSLLLEFCVKLGKDKLPPDLYANALPFTHNLIFALDRLPVDPSKRAERKLVLRRSLVNHYSLLGVLMLSIDLQPTARGHSVALMGSNVGVADSQRAEISGPSQALVVVRKRAGFAASVCSLSPERLKKVLFLELPFSFSSPVRSPIYPYPG